MSMTVLFDLDDTLLMNSMEVFLPAYLKALGAHLSHRFPADVLIRNLLSATKHMAENNDPGLTLEEAFDQIFYPGLGVTKEELRPELEHFYQDVFPSLQGLTQPVPQAPELLAEVIRRGWRVVIATNPLFPITAIHQRLSWAGISPEQVPYSLVTSFENFHFAKPQPAYVAEILAQLGWPNGPVVMIGNSLSDDLRPAAEINLPTYWIGDSQAVSGLHPRSSQGKLDGVLAWLEQAAQMDGLAPHTSPAGMLAIMKSTPAALATLAKRLVAEDWDRCKQVGEWNLTEIICHLRDVDQEVNWPRMQRICHEENPFLPGINSDPWAIERDYAAQDGPTALREFIRVRSQLVHLLENFATIECWKRPARHAIFGPTTMGELISFITTHDRTHIQQVYQNLPEG